MPRHTHPRRRGPNRDRSWRIERTARIVRARRARIRNHIDAMNAYAATEPPASLGDYLAVRNRGDLDEGRWEWGAPTPNPWFWLRLRQVADFRPSPTPPLCRCPICRVPLDHWTPDVRYVRRVEHGSYDLRDGDPRWVPAERPRRT